MSTSVPTRLLFETHELCKFYRASTRSEVRALNGVTLGVERGSLTVLTGPSGSGKTTLLALLGGLERATSGRVVFDGQELTTCSDVGLARVRRRVGFVFQDFSLIPNLTALENVYYPLIPRGVPRGERRRRGEEFLERFGMGSKRDVRAGELSGGEQQRVAIARALAGQPEALLADEPTSNLDAETSSLLLSALRELRQEGKTVVVASHDPRVIELASATHALAEGRLSQ
jgi:putative ABC transport system ATP-binding protein